jgi:hypothetical protein
MNIICRIKGHKLSYWYFPAFNKTQAECARCGKQLSKEEEILLLNKLRRKEQ